jgi:hypothetical protein
MKTSSRQIWINFLALLPGTILTILTLDAVLPKSVSN